MKDKFYGFGYAGLFAIALAACGVMFSLPTAEGRGADAAGGRSLTIRNGNTGLYLTLPGIQDAVYDIQVATNLKSEVWRPLSPVTGTNGETVYPLPTDGFSGGFYRVLFPQPVVHAGEPALLPEAGGETLHITGQYFYPGDCVRVGGVILTNVTFVSSTLLSVTLPTLPPGLHDVEVLGGKGGGVLALLTQAVEIAPPPQRALQGPPEWPPAGPVCSTRHRGHVTVLKSHDTGGNGVEYGVDCGGPFGSGCILLPGGDFSGISGYTFARHVDDPGYGGGGGGGVVRLLASKKGYDYYKARSDMGAASLVGGPGDGVDEDCDGIASFRGHVTVLKAYDSGVQGSGFVVGTEECDDANVTDMSPKRGAVPAIPDSSRLGSIVCLPSPGQTTSVRLHSGEVCVQANDLDLPGRGLDFVWTRTYRSRTGEPSPQGNRWTHGYDVRCVTNENSVEVFDGTGRHDTLWAQADGTYSCPGLFREGTFTGGVFRLTFADTGFWVFNVLDGTPAGGRLSRIQDRNGNAVTLAYSPLGLLTNVTDTVGRVHTVAYTPEGRVASVTDSSGRSVTYTYYGNGEIGGDVGDLKSVTSPSVTGTPNGNDFPDGKTVTYTYRTDPDDQQLSHLLTTVTDGRGNTALTFTYDTDPTSPARYRCVSVQCGTEVPTRVTYEAQSPSPDNGFATMRAIVNDPVGNVTESFFDVRNRCVALREFTGRAEPGVPVTDKDNRPVRKLRGRDPDVYETVMRWNNDHLCSRLTLASGLVGKFVYGGDANPLCRIRKRPDLLLQEWDARAPGGADTDGDGRPDLLTISSRYAYDPRFGTDPTCMTRRRGFPGAQQSGVSCSAAPGGGEVCGNTDHFLVSHTDPRGTVTTFEYDSRGNCTNAVTPYTDSQGRQVVRVSSATYDSHGQCLSVKCPADTNGRRREDHVTWSNGMPVSVVCDGGPGGLGLTTRFERDARGNVTRYVDARSNDVLITYNALNQPVSVQQALHGTNGATRTTTTFSYDASDNLVRVDRENRKPDGDLDPANPQWSSWVTYDALCRPTSVAHELAHVKQQIVMTNEFVYDAAGQLVLRRLPEAVSGADSNNTVAYAYDERGLLFQRERAPGTGLSSVETFDYDQNVNLTRVARSDAASPQETTYTYDGFDRCVRRDDPMGNTVTRCFDANGNLSYERCDGEISDQPGTSNNVMLAESRCVYDALNRMTEQVDSFFDIFTELSLSDGSSRSSWTYAPNGQPASSRDDNTNATVHTYDTVGRLSSVTDPAGNVTSYTYDPNGNVLSVTRTDRSGITPGEQVFVKTCVYDPLDRCVSVSDNVGNTVTRQYDSSHNVVSETDSNGNETVREFDGLGRTLTSVRYEGTKERGVTINTSHTEYRNNRLISSTDGNGQTATYQYDACDRRVLTTRPDGSSVSLVWSPRSNLAVCIDPNGTIVTNTYDLCDRVVHRDIAVRNGVAPSTTFESYAYDGLSRVVVAQNDVCTLAYGYDSLGNRISSSQNGRVTTAAFDGVGNRLSLTCPSGIVAAVSYDALNRPSAFTARMSASADPVAGSTFAYDGPTRLAGVSRANGVNTRLLWNGQQGSKNDVDDFGWGQVYAVSHVRTNDATVIDQRKKAYDRDQNKTRDAMVTAWYDGAPVITNVYGYDGMSRLTRSIISSSIATNNLRYVLDANGNRQVVTHDGRLEAYIMDATMPEPADFQMNQYTVTPYGTNAYDADGNLVSSANASETIFYRFDYANRLVEVAAPNAIGTMDPVATYGYDPLGRRVSKTVFTSDGLPPVTTTYVYDDTDNDCDGTSDDVLETYEDGVRQRTFVFPHVLELAGDDFVHEVSLMGRTVINDEGRPLYLLEDELGSTLALTDQGGHVIERYAYGDYGQPQVLTPDGQPRARSVVGNDILFHGMWWDDETGLYACPRRSCDGNPLFKDNTMGGTNPLYDRLGGPGGSDGGSCDFTYMDPRTGQLVSSGTSPSSWDGYNGRVYANATPTTRRNEGGRHTPFHNTLAAGGGNDVLVRKRPGRVKYGNITLKRGPAGGASWTLGSANAFAGRSSGVGRARHEIAMNAIRNMK